ncbi:MAG: DNA-directed RNA polymerase subunit omega, partial [Desulfobulbia bacterium]
EDVIQSMQQYVEVDEPEPEAAPLLEANMRTAITDPDDKSKDIMVDQMTEDELLRGLESIPMAENNWHGSKRPRNRR